MSITFVIFLNLENIYTGSENMYTSTIENN